MGTPQPPNRPGTACPLCWGPGTAFGDHETPYVVKVLFCHIAPGAFWIPGDDEFIRQEHWLPQTVHECNWKIIYPSYAIELSYSVLGSLLFFTNTDTGKLVFSCEHDDPCPTLFEGRDDAPHLFQGTGGTGLVQFPEEP